MTLPAPYLTVAETAKLLGVTTTRVNQLIDAKKFTVKKIRMGYRDVRHIPRAEVKARLKEKGL